MDCIHYKVRDDGQILSRAVYAVLGITIEGYKEILSITVGANETSKFWLGMLNDLKNRRLNRQYRKVTKTKSVFPSDTALEKMPYLASENVVKKWT